MAISFSNIILTSIRPGTETLGRLPGSDIYCDVHQYPMAVKTPGILIIRLKSPLLCFANSNIIRERYLPHAACNYLLAEWKLNFQVRYKNSNLFVSRIAKWINEEEAVDDKGNIRSTTRLVILDTSSKC